MEQTAQPYRFVWEETALGTFFMAYERERVAAGVGATLQRVSIRQRADVIMTMTGLNVGACWRRVGEESAKDLWRRYLTPVLAETRESAAALGRTIEDHPLPGYFLPKIGEGEADEIKNEGVNTNTDILGVPPPPSPPGIRLADFWKAISHVFARRETGAVVAVLAAAVLLPWLWMHLGRSVERVVPRSCPPACATVTPHTDTTAPAPIDPSQPMDPARSARLRFLDVTIAAAEQYGFSISPYTLAEYYAGESDFVTEPALFLQAMLKRWPLPAYEPIPPTLAGAYALGQYSLAAAEIDLATGLDRDRLKLGIDVATQETPDDIEGAQTKLYARVQAFRYEETRTQVRRLISEQLQVDPARVTDAARLMADLNANELQVIELTSAIEKALGIAIPDSAAATLFTTDPANASFAANPNATVADVMRVIATALDQPVLQGTMQPTPQRWPDWPRWLLFVPLLPVLGWAIVTGWRAGRAALTNPPENLRGTPTPIASRELASNAPKPERRLVRQISWHPPVPSPRLDVGRSIAQTLQRGGFAQPVFGTRSRAVEFLFLVPHHRDNDHERERVARLIEALETGGLPLNVYEYSPDPRTLVGASARSTQSGPLDLRALRELHADARLVLVTDGSDLVDYFTERPYKFVAESLSAWPARMLLTPVPMAEWGEREMNLSAALGAPIGRATAEGFHDLAAGFGTGRIARWRPPPPVSGGGMVELVERIQGWLKAAAGLLGATQSVPPRPELVRDDDYTMLSDVPPPDEIRNELIADLGKWLGADGFYWLAACAGYPQLRYVITVYLGNRLRGARGPIYDEEHLAKLCLLPWFWQGRMPPWLRESLFSALTLEQRAAVGEALAAMLLSARAEKTTPGALADRHPPRSETSKRRTLTIWLPDENGAEIAPDEVVADFMLRDIPEVVPTLHLPASRAIFFDRARAIVLVRLAAVVAVGLWCWAMLHLWPSSTAAPHAPGVWLPLIAIAVVTLFGLPAVAVYRRLKNLGWFAGRAPDAFGRAATTRKIRRDQSEVLG
ncbi:phosphopantetheine-binding protein [Mesorhizobium sp. M0768]|uniref:acyl carrier protein n=1 Tax=Mesorhizobium sp. M0768 TaxID=2956996 RepID=UPI00333C238B